VDDVQRAVIGYKPGNAGLGSTKLQSSTLGLTKQTNEAGTSYYARTPAGLMVDERLPASATDFTFAGDDPINANDPSGECFADRFGTWGPDCGRAVSGIARLSAGREESRASAACGRMVNRWPITTPGTRTDTPTATSPMRAALP